MPAPQPLLLALGAAALLLAGAIALELAGNTAGAPEAPAASAARPLVAAPAGEAAAPGGAAVARQVAIILMRPLFTPGRRPEAANDAATDAGLPRLTGIAVTPDGKSAIFAGAPGSKAVVVAEGGRVGRYVVTAIDAAGVTIIGPEGRRVVQPAFDPEARSSQITRPPASAPAPPPPPPPARAAPPAQTPPPPPVQRARPRI